jgi:hypothetical protein
VRHDIPTAYAAFRTAWSVVHFVLLAALFVVVLRWWFDDGQGGRLLAGWWQTSVSVSAAIFNALPFPWDGE